MKRRSLMAAALPAPARKKIVDEMQTVFWQDPPHVPLGMYDQPTALRTYITDVPDGWPQFYGLKEHI